MCEPITQSRIARIIDDERRIIARHLSNHGASVCFRLPDQLAPVTTEDSAADHLFPLQEPEAA